jgi:hypothetical protein
LEITTSARVVALRRLDLDHLGAEIAERHSHYRSRENAREVDDEDVLQRAHGALLLRPGLDQGERLPLRLSVLAGNSSPDHEYLERKAEADKESARSWPSLTMGCRRRASRVLVKWPLQLQWECFQIDRSIDRGAIAMLN